MAYDPNDPFSDPNQYQPPPEPQAPAQPSYVDFQRDYWAPDRNAVLAQMAPSPQGPTMAPQLPTMGNTAPSGNTGVTGGYTPPDLTGIVNGSLINQPASAPLFNYERARDSWMSGQYGTGEAGARAWAAANGVPYNGGDTITLPNGGGQIDIIGNFQGGAGRNMANNWTPAGGNGPNPGGQGFSAPGGQAGQAGGFGSASGSYGITSGPLQDQYRATLLRLMQQGEAPVDEQSLGIRQPYEAAQLAANRQLEQAQQANAERLYAEGQLGAKGSNELANLGQQGRERTAVGLAGIKSGLIQNEIGARRQQLQQALQLANAVGARQEAMQLQRELAQLENQYRYAALGQQESQFGRGLGFQQGQWNDRYGLERMRLQNEMNREALLAAQGSGA